MACFKELIHHFNSYLIANFEADGMYLIGSAFYNSPSLILVGDRTYCASDIDYLSICNKSGDDLPLKVEIEFPKTTLEKFDLMPTKSSFYTIKIASVRCKSIEDYWFFNGSPRKCNYREQKCWPSKHNTEHSIAWGLLKLLLADRYADASYSLGLYDLLKMLNYCTRDYLLVPNFPRVFTHCELQQKLMNRVLLIDEFAQVYLNEIQLSQFKTLIRNRIMAHQYEYLNPNGICILKTLLFNYIRSLNAHSRLESVLVEHFYNE